MMKKVVLDYGRLSARAGLHKAPPWLTAVHAGAGSELGIRVDLTAPAGIRFRQAFCKVMPALWCWMLLGWPV